MSQRVLVCLTLLLGLPVWSVSAAPEARLALVIGNSASAILILASPGVRGCQLTPTWLRWVSPENQGGSDDESLTLR